MVGTVIPFHRVAGGDSLSAFFCTQKNQAKELVASRIFLCLKHQIRHPQRSLYVVTTSLETRISGRNGAGVKNDLIDENLYGDGPTGEYSVLPRIEGFELYVPLKHARLAAFIARRYAGFDELFPGKVRIYTSTPETKRQVSYDDVRSTAGNEPAIDAHPLYLC